MRKLAANDVVSFFWSPDGSRIATIGISTPAAPGSARLGGPAAATARLVSTRPDGGTGPRVADAEGIDVALQFVDVAAETATPAQVVSLSPLYVNQILPYFDQYALSHRVWSPDGTSILLPVIDAGGNESLEVAACGRVGAARARARDRRGSGAPDGRPAPVPGRQRRVGAIARASTITPMISSASGHTMSLTLGMAMLEAADREQDQPEHELPAPPRAADAAHERDEQERDAEAQGADARPGDDARGGEQVGGGERRDDRSEVERAEPAVDEPRDEERDADREEQQRAGGLEGGEDLAQQQERAEHDQEDPEPRQPAAAPRPADVVPFPAVDLDAAAS